MRGGRIRIPHQFSQRIAQIRAKAFRISPQHVLDSGLGCFLSKQHGHFLDVVPLANAMGLIRLWGQLMLLGAVGADSLCLRLPMPFPVENHYPCFFCMMSYFPCEFRGRSGIDPEVEPIVARRGGQAATLNP
jgi:hypothetical protein